MTETPNIDSVIIEAAFSLIEEVGWARLSMAEAAEKAGISQRTVQTRYPTKALLLNAFMRHIDDLVLGQEAPFDEFDTDRDRIFEVLMLRFEAMQPYKTALKHIARDLPRDPLSVIANGPSAALSMAKMLAAANASANGLLGIAQAHGLLTVWVATARIWLQDDSPDLTRTMAALDRNLRRGERFMKMLPRMAPPRPAAAR